ncbi:MAG: methylenetetrahydrofolate--tRNA-(uracil(54)-C(5))-methyltransferase (FADH(2)-oxidizing) TrmFO [Christensenellales bacterium]
MKPVSVIGAGLSGSEAAWQLANRSVFVRLYDMKPQEFSPAHSSPQFCELVCSNSLKSNSETNCCGLLKAEMRMLNSLVIACADQTKVPAGGALAVDRESFAEAVTEKLRAHPHIEIISRRIDIIPDEPCVIATGPLTHDLLAAEIAKLLGEKQLFFYDASAPVVTAESLDMSRIFRMSRYGKGEDYLNCPMTKAEYDNFYSNLIQAETVPQKAMEPQKLFEGCMPVESMAKRGYQTLAFGMMKPVGLADPATGKRPFAAVQLRQDDTEGRLYNLVGFQTNLKFPEQKRVFSMIPGLENAEFVRYGVMHRNTFINAPKHLLSNFQSKIHKNLFFGGQITGVEGYVESAASGLMAALGMHRHLQGKEPVDFNRKTAVGALAHYIADYPGADFQPMNANFGILEEIAAIRDKKMRYEALAVRAKEELKNIIIKYDL